MQKIINFRKIKYFNLISLIALSMNFEQKQKKILFYTKSNFKEKVINLKKYQKAKQRFCFHFRQLQTMSTNAASRPLFKKHTDPMGTSTPQQLYPQPNPKYQQKPSTFIGQGQKINFQSQDSQGSDISYQSSIQSQQDINIGEIEYFKEQMGRFFINYPELINDRILDLGGELEEEEEEDGDWSGNKYTMLASGLNKNWNMLADQILSEAKQSSSFLQSLSRRIALYRTKLHQQDFIDILLKQQKNIMKDIDLQISVKKKQSKGSKNFAIDHSSAADNVYLSWRKKNQLQHRLGLQKEEVGERNEKGKNVQTVKNNTRALSANVNTGNRASLSKFQSRKQSLFNPSPSNQLKQPKQSMFFLTSNQALVNTNAAKTEKPTTAGGNLSRAVINQTIQRVDNKSRTSYQLKDNFNHQLKDNFNHQLKDNFNQNKRSFSLKGQNRKSIQKLKHQQAQKQTKANLATSSQYQSYWRHLVNFQPRTQGGRQLCELIRKTNTPNDQLGIKKTILQFLSRNKEMVQNEMILKSTISQKIQKLYTDDSKELLMFYPTKMSATQLVKPIINNSGGKQDAANTNAHNGLLGTNLNSDDGEAKQINSDNGPDNSHKLFDEGEKFMNLLEDIVEGPLMKYWMMIQEKKL